MRLKYIFLSYVLKTGIYFFTFKNNYSESDRVFLFLEKVFLRIGSSLAQIRILEMEKIVETDAYTVFTLLGHSDYHRYIISYQSFLKYLLACPAFIVCDDGTLLPNEKNILMRLPGVYVYSSETLDLEANRFYKNSNVNTYRNIAVRNRKVTDPIFFKKKYKKMLILDSDVGFFSYPKALLDFTATPRSKTDILYIQDIQDAYVTSRENLKNIFHTSCRPKVNSGLLCFSEPVLTKAFIVTFFAKLEKYKKLYHYRFEWMDQTPWGLLAHSHTSQSLPETYYIGMEKTPLSAICRHYVHGSRQYFIRDLVRLVE